MVIFISLEWLPHASQVGLFAGIRISIFFFGQTLFDLLRSRASMEQHVAVLAFPFTSHPLALLRLVRRLASAAPHTKFSFFSTAKSNSSLFSAQNADDLGNLKPYNVADGVPKGQVISDNIEEEIGFFMKAAPRNFRQAMEVAAAERCTNISCLITDSFIWFGADMAEEMGIAWITYMNSSLFGLSAHYYTDTIRQKIGLNGGREDQTLDIIPGFSKIRVADLPEQVLAEDLDSGMAGVLHKMVLALPRATAIIMNTFEELEPIVAADLKSKLPKLLCLAASSPSSPSPSNPDTGSCLSWLDKQKPNTVAYISFGTLVCPSPDELAALTEALEATGVPFLWSIKDHAKQHLPKGFLERTRDKGKLVAWAPQMQILKHPSVGVHVSHSAWNAVMESIAGEKPMICRPFFADQMVNRRAVEEVWGIGVGVEPGCVFTTTWLVSALERVLSSQGKKMRDNVRALKELWSKAEEPDGSSSQNFRTWVELVS